MPHILVVEDDDLSQRFVTYHLEHAGFRVTAVPDGAEMMATLDREAIDLVLLDLGLPDGDGLSRAQQARQRSSVPIVVLTARKGEDDRLMALSLGADDYLTKPCDPRELVLRVRNVLARGGVPCAPIRPVRIEPPQPTMEDAPAERRQFVDRRRKSRPWKTAFVVAGITIAVAIAAGVAQTMWWYKSGPATSPSAETGPASAPLPPAADTSTPAPAAAPAPAVPAERQPTPDEQRLAVTVTAQPRDPATPAPPAPAPSGSNAQLEDGYATAARSYAWVLKSKCPQLPEGEQWQITKHTDLVRYVNRQHAGDWQPYISQWVDRLAQLQAIYARGSGIKLASGEVLSGDKLRDYIDQTQKRLDVTLCLAREAADYAHKKNLNQR
jgi:CheY-like chemotaxis protein